MSNKCIIKSIAQVSCQQPLSDEWLTSPILYDESYAAAIEPNFKEFINPIEARRLGRVLKRALCTSLSALRQAGLNNPDAIITGTGMGCLENSEKFLLQLAQLGESCLKPTLFMQSTHNTISSLIGINIKCHGYNNTYSQKACSFESALLDAWLQLKAGAIKSVLVGSHDEVTPLFAKILKRNSPDFKLVSETSVASVLVAEESAQPNQIEVENVNILYRPLREELIRHITEPAVVMLGLNGNESNDRHYCELLGKVSGNPIMLHYKPIFGDNFSASAIGFYAATRLLQTGKIPEFMYHSKPAGNVIPSEITLINHYEGNTWSLIKLKKH
ncbi:MAG: beta-ketoacyl synthase chain length factor [Muribaculaceae bacterium]|nr:beta-ketoacyl synthase chain length factor [Muribaculaceae bacterium]